MIPSGQQIGEAESWTERRPAPRRTPALLSGFLPTPRDTRAAANRSVNHRALALAIEREVLPRLIRALGTRASRPPRQDHVAPLVRTFARLVLTTDATAAAEFVERVDGIIDVENLYLDLLAPAARHLGDLWTEDICDFADVTIGVYRLQQVLRAFSSAFQANAGASQPARRALLLTFAGERHTFGLAMLDEFFRRAGWQVRREAAVAPAAAARLVRGEWFEIVGFSVGSGARLDAVATAIKQVRRTSRNPAIGIMVGGPIFHDNPSLASHVGADGTAVDGRQAVKQAQTLMIRQPAG